MLLHPTAFAFARLLSLSFLFSMSSVRAFAAEPVYATRKRNEADVKYCWP